MLVLVDSSVWIDYFRDGKNSGELDSYIDDNTLVINDIILAELIPFLKIKKQRKIIDLLYSIDKLELNINWDQLIDIQHHCLKKGMHGIGIPDLIIAQNAIQNSCELYSLDNHFKLLQQITDLNMLD